jgi:carbamoyl-phosphate synthase large subunit
VGAIKALRMAGHRGRIVATDPDPLAAGLALADRGVVIPPVTDPHFFIRAMALIREDRIGVILPTSGFDIVEYSRQRDVLERLGAVFIGCDTDVMETCIDKWRFHTRLAGRFPVPRTVLAADAARARVFPPLRFAEVTIGRYFDELVWDVARARLRASHPARAAAPSAR